MISVSRQLSPSHLARVLADASAKLVAGETLAALAAYEQLLRKAPDHPAAIHGIGLVCYQLGRVEDAECFLRRAIALEPDNAEYLNNLGLLLADRRQLQEAIVCHHRATRLRPEFAAAHHGLGNALRKFGQCEAAIACFERALALTPDFTAAYINLGSAYKALNQWEAALAAYRHALVLTPNSAIAHHNLGTALYQLGDLAAAATALERAVAIDPRLPEAWVNLGNIAKDQGRLDDAIAIFRKLYLEHPSYSPGLSNLLFTLNYVDGAGQQEIYTLHREFNARYAASLTPQAPRFAQTKDPSRRLRIGYVSPDLRGHACAFFLEPLFEHHDRERFEIHAYAEVANPDSTTARLRGLVDAWHSTVGLDDDQVAAQIRQDGIDILIDLAGHTANSRILALARKPAPVQLTYLGYPATTGMDAIGYRLTDAVAEPKGASDQYYVEALVRLPNSLWCYKPFPDMPEVSPLPAISNGYVTLGSFNNFAKVGPRVIALWAATLRAVPSARLSLLCAADDLTQAQVRARFREHGVDPSRLSLYGRESRTAYLQRFATVDIALDPFPCNGGTTTCDALWMGLPVVTVIGDTFLSRASYSVLSAAGVPEFAASTMDGYVECVVNLVRDPHQLALTRETLRERLRTSPLLDGALLARNIEAAYRNLWTRWCQEDT
jgi:protein O-GlcNAc transferase